MPSNVDRAEQENLSTSLAEILANYTRLSATAPTTTTTTTTTTGDYRGARRAADFAAPDGAPAAEAERMADAHNAGLLRLQGYRTDAAGEDLWDLARYVEFNIPLEHRARRGFPVSAVAPAGRPVTFEPFYFFFYGSLQHPGQLGSVCDLGRGGGGAAGGGEPVLRKASIKGWRVMMWGPFPSLVEAGPEDRVEGLAWLCESGEHVAALRSYETDNYRMEYCDIELELAEGEGEGEGGAVKKGRVFVNNGAVEQLEEGKFVLEDYVKTYH